MCHYAVSSFYALHKSLGAYNDGLRGQPLMLLHSMHQDNLFDAAYTLISYLLVGLDQTKCIAENV